MKKYFLGIFSSSFLIATIFVLFSNKDFKGLYFLIWIIVFLLSLFIVTSMLPIISQIDGNLKFYWVLFYAFVFGGVAALASVYAIFGFAPAWNSLAAYYFIFGGGAGVLSLCVNLLINRFL